MDHPLHAMWEVFLTAGGPGEQVLACWVAKEQLHAVFRATCASGIRDRLVSALRRHRQQTECAEPAGWCCIQT
ncbi:hypothetical protein [Nonomuraea sp. B1E8]|uniref:hypothetical protein n=1 Tax=unclassified Nonomuraea TaxID=2593643 RepID=UPI00325E7CAB